MITPTNADICRDAALHCEAGTLPDDRVIARYGNPSEDNDRIATLEVRPGMAEGQYQALALRLWGSGHWCRADGQAGYFTTRQDADKAAERWISEGER